ncbi:MAG: class I SAM-dependent methyltransferase [Microgenomates group bacterium]
MFKIYHDFKHNIFEKSLTILSDAKHSLKFINKFKKNRKTLLDIGCGSGIFLNEAITNKLQVSGIDISSKMVNYLKSKYNFPVYLGDIVSTKISYLNDIVSLNQVIEHFSKPRTLIKRCYKLLNKNGLIYIATPNVGSLVSKIRKEKFDYVIPPEHLSYFNKTTLNTLLTSEGFKVLKFNTWSYPVDLAGLIKHLLKRDNHIEAINTGKKSKIQNFNIKRIKYFLFDQLFCRLFYKVLNINNGGTMIEVIAQKI